MSNDATVQSIVSGASLYELREVCVACTDWPNG